MLHCAVSNHEDIPADFHRPSNAAPLYDTPDPQLSPDPRSYHIAHRRRCWHGCESTRVDGSRCRWPCRCAATSRSGAGMTGAPGNLGARFSGRNDSHRKGHELGHHQVRHKPCFKRGSGAGMTAEFQQGQRRHERRCKSKEHFALSRVARTFQYRALEDLAMFLS